MYSSEILEKSIIVAAHPDDEVLCFSSILEKIGEVIICFLDYKPDPKLGIGRRKSLREYPIRNISCLEINESESFGGANWNNPEITKYGIKLSNKSISNRKYIENYYELTKRLKNNLVECHNVFTHNPWGEYGHEDHIQVYRVVKELQQQMNFNLWFSNYCSNISFNLMLRYISGFDSEYVTLETNKKLGNYIKSSYKKNGCWTWYDDWQWFNEESFMKDRSSEERTESYGHIFPLNLIKVDFPIESKRKSQIFSLLTSIKSSMKKRS